MIWFQFVILFRTVFTAIWPCVPEAINEGFSMGITLVENTVKNFPCSTNLEDCSLT